MCISAEAGPSLERNKAMLRERVLDQNFKSDICERVLSPEFNSFGLIKKFRVLFEKMD